MSGRIRNYRPIYFTKTPTCFTADLLLPPNIFDLEKSKVKVKDAKMLK